MTAGVLHEHVYLVVRIAATDAHHVAYVSVVHADYQVKTVVVGACQLTCCLAMTGNAVFGEFPTCWRIDAVAYLLGRGGSRLYIELFGYAGLVDQVFHDELCHRGTADVAVTDEEDAVLHNV